jgi:hypothetical protein
MRVPGAYFGWEPVQRLAEMAVHVGDYGAAFTALEQLLSNPTTFSIHFLSWIPSGTPCGPILGMRHSWSASTEPPADRPMTTVSGIASAPNHEGRPARAESGYEAC